MRAALTLLLAAGLATVCHPALGEPVYRLRVTTMVPPNRNGELEVKRWKRDVERDSGGKLKLRLIPWRLLGTDEEIMGKLRSGKLDAANVGTHAISTFVRQAKILSAPGVFRSKAHHARARELLRETFAREAYENGFKLIGWSEVTPGRILASRPVRAPKDLAGLRAWREPESAWKQHLHAMVGAEDAPLRVAGVLDALRAKQLDVVYGTAGGLMALQWFAHLKYISGEFGTAQLGFVMGRRSHDGLPPHLARVFVERSEALTARVIAEIQRQDAKVFDKLLTRGLRRVELDHEAWQACAAQLRERLVGEQYTRELMERVRQL